MTQDSMDRLIKLADQIKNKKDWIFKTKYEGMGETKPICEIRPGVELEIVTGVDQYITREEDWLLMELLPLVMNHLDELLETTNSWMDY